MKKKEISNSKKCFVMMPFAGEFNDFYFMAIKPTVEELGLICFRSDEIKGHSIILKDIVKSIFDADIIIVDVSMANPNVFYELGVAHSLSKNVILITQRVEDIPFDLCSFRMIVYSNSLVGVMKFTSELTGNIRPIIEFPDSYSPISEFIPNNSKFLQDEIIEKQKEIDFLSKEVQELKLHIQSKASVSIDKPEISSFIEEIKGFLKVITEDNIIRLQQQNSNFQAENTMLNTKLEYLDSLQSEIKRLKNKTLVNPHWKGRDFQIEEDLCFLLMPFREPWSDDVWILIETIVKNAGFRCQRADEQAGRIVMDDIWEGINKSKIIIADLTAKNPNVTYEVGLVDVLGKEVILLSQTPNDVPFDFLGIRLITYDNSIGGVRKLTEDLQVRLKQIRINE